VRCRGKGGPSTHYDEPDEMIISVCRFCEGTGYQEHRPTERFPSAPSKELIAYPPTMRLENPSMHGVAVRFVKAIMAARAFQDQLTAAQFRAACKRYTPRRPLRVKPSSKETKP